MRRPPTTRVIAEDLTVLMIDGVRVGAVLPVVPEGAPYAVREGIARRRLVVLDGRCPCGAELALTDARAGRLTVAHEDRCPARDARLRKAIRRWARGGLGRWAA